MIDVGLTQVVSQWMGCTACDLSANRTQQVFGRLVGSIANVRIAMVGEAPGHDEDETGIAFIGRSGQLLDQWIGAARITDVFITNVVACRPPRNRDPSRLELRECWGRLFATLQVFQPRVIVTIGRVAGQWMLEDDRTMQYMSTHMYRLKVGDSFRTVVIPIHHPAYLLRSYNAELESSIIDRLRVAKRIVE